MSFFDLLANYPVIVGVPKEIKAQENRVSMIPSGVAQLVKRGHQVLVEKNAGTGADYSDREYRDKGQKLSPNMKICLDAQN